MTSEGNTRDLLLRFLLGELPPDETDAFEQLLLSDQEFADRIAEARYDLLDAYAAGELDDSTRRRVAKVLLQSPGSSVSLAVAEKLQKTRTSDATRLPRTKRVPSIARKRVWIPVAAAIALAIAGGLYIRHGRGRSSAPLTEIRTRQTSAAPGQSEPAFVLLLEPQVTRNVGQSRTVVLPPRAPSLEVQLVLAAEEPSGPYRVVVKSQQGKRIASFENLRPHSVDQTRFLQITIPTRLVPPGNYLFEIYGQGTSALPIHSYAVNIVPGQTPRK